MKVTGACAFRYLKTVASSSSNSSVSIKSSMEINSTFLPGACSPDLLLKVFNNPRMMGLYRKGIATCHV